MLCCAHCMRTGGTRARASARVVAVQEKVLAFRAAHRAVDLIRADAPGGGHVFQITPGGRAAYPHKGAHLFRAQSRFV